ncbi:MAG: hypothetical protein HY673_18080 [Chloroflexi bacterium]|nr:hypothetical protein [Chloroflexota bacterium]
MKKVGLSILLVVSVLGAVRPGCLCGPRRARSGLNPGARSRSAFAAAGQMGATGG